MHCGVDFERPIDADSGQAVRDRHDGRGGYAASADDGESNATAVGLVVAVVGLVTLPFVTPPGMTLFYVTAAVVAGVVAGSQSSLAAAASKGGLALAVAPLVLWALSLVVPGTGGFSVGSLVPALAYAIVVSSLARSIG